LWETPKVIASCQVKDWEQWKSAYVGHNEARENADIKTVYYGHELEDQNKVHVLMDVPSIDTLQAFMQQPNNQKVIEEAGHIQESTTMVICSD
jgi:PHP family Zn ribbon phosphoesterase